MRHHIETAELADAELDAVSGGLLNETLGAVGGTVDGVEGLAGGATSSLPTDGVLPGGGVSANAQA